MQLKKYKINTDTLGALTDIEKLPAAVMESIGYTPKSTMLKLQQEIDLLSNAVDSDVREHNWTMFHLTKKELWTETKVNLLNGDIGRTHDEIHQIALEEAEISSDVYAVVRKISKLKKRYDIL